MKKLSGILIATALLVSCSSGSEIDRESFASTDRICYPQTWFHFISTNVSMEGITADLEAIAASGISGVQFFHGDRGHSRS